MSDLTVRRSETMPASRQSRLAILGEIALVLMPLYISLLIASRSGAQQIVLTEQLVILGNPVTYLAT